MVDVVAGLTGFNALMNGAKALAQMNNESVRLQASIDLQRQIFAAQQDYAALLKTVNDLEAKIVSFENWDAEKQRYEPKQFDPGVTIYVLKPGEDRAEQGQHFCAHCYANGKARILQATERITYDRRVRVCHECKAELAYGDHVARARPRVVQRRVISRYDPFSR